MRGPCRIGLHAEHCIRLNLQRQSKKHSLQCEEHSFRFVSGPSRPVTHHKHVQGSLEAHPNLAHYPRLHACRKQKKKDKCVLYVLLTSECMEHEQYPVQFSTVRYPVQYPVTKLT